MAAASWLAWMCIQGVMGPPAAIIALVGMAALAALIRRHTGMEAGMALCLIAVVGWSGSVGCVRAAGRGVGCGGVTRSGLFTSGAIKCLPRLKAHIGLDGAPSFLERQTERFARRTRLRIMCGSSRAD